MRHPGPVAPVARLSALVLSYLGDRLLGDFRVSPVGNKRRHAADGMGAAAVTGLDQQLGVGAHEGDGHRDLGAVRKDEPGRFRNFLITEKM